MGAWNALRALLSGEYIEGDRGACRSASRTEEPFLLKLLEPLGFPGIKLQAVCRVAILCRTADC
jgi:hypothetical protein